jgi:hypothetical protein
MSSFTIPETLTSGNHQQEKKPTDPHIFKFLWMMSLTPREYTHVEKSLNLTKCAASSNNIIGYLHVRCILHVST